MLSKCITACYILHWLTYCWESQLSTHYPGINVVERVITNCAPLVVVAYLYPALVRTEYTSKTNISISARCCSIHWSCVIRPASRTFSSHNHNSVIRIRNINLIEATSWCTASPRLPLLKLTFFCQIQHILKAIVFHLPSLP